MNDFKKISEVAYELSENFKEISFLDNKKAKSAHLLTKALDNSQSILKLVLPNPHLKNASNYLDYSSVLSLFRNLIELSNITWYILEDNVSDEEFQFRLDLLKLHNYMSTIFVIEELFDEKKKLDTAMEKIERHRKKIIDSSHFSYLKKEKQKLILKGKISTVFTQFEIAEKRKINVKKFKGYYKLMSVHTHSSPSSFTQLNLIREGSDEEFGPIQLGLLTHYCSSHFASIIKTITKLWGIQYASEQTKKLIKYYADSKKL